MSTFSKLASLTLVVEDFSLTGLAQRVSSDFLRRTTVVRLRGAGHTGVGEDVDYEADEQLAFQDWGGGLPLTGRFTLAEFSRHLDDVDLFPGPPRQAASRDYRRWAVESAALDLALRQAGWSLAGCLQLEPRPVRFVVSTSLGRPASTAPLERILQARPDLGFKLDASPAWTPELIERIRTTAPVHVVDFKGAYRGTTVDQAADPELAQRVAEGFPDVWLEDPHRTPEVDRVLEPHRRRVAWDAPIHSVEDIEALPFQPGAVNMKPSRFGTLERLFAAYDHCGERDLPMYGGGQFELGPGRGQIQRLASLFHPSAPNDVAPSAYNTTPLPDAPPASPLPPVPPTPGFR